MRDSASARQLPKCRPFARKVASRWQRRFFSCCQNRRKPFGIKSAPVRIRTSNLLIRSQMLYPVELRAQNLAFTYENTLQLQQQRVVLSREIPSHNFRRFHTDCDLKDRRLTFSGSWSQNLPRPAPAARRALLYSFLTAVKLPERRPGGALFPADMRYGEGIGDVSKPPCAGRIVPSKMLMTSEQCAEQGATMTPAKRPSRRSSGTSGLKTARLSD